VRFVPVSAFHDHNVRASAEEEEKEGGGGDDDEGSVLTSWGITCYADIVGAEEAGAAASRGGGGGAGAARRGGAGEDVSRGSSSCCSLVDAIDSFRAPPRPTHRPLRIIVEEVSESTKKVEVTGQLCQGQVDVGQPLRLMPWGDRAVPSRLADASSGAPLAHSAAGEHSGLLQLTLGVSDNVDGNRVHVGDVLCCSPDVRSLSAATAATAAASSSSSSSSSSSNSSGGSVSDMVEVLVPVTRRFEARLQTFEALRVPFIPGSQVQLHVGHAEVAASVSKLVSLLDHAGGVKKVSG
jgi:translation elongation factor EF-1alpha